MLMIAVAIITGRLKAALCTSCLLLWALVVAGLLVARSGGQWWTYDLTFVSYSVSFSSIEPVLIGLAAVSMGGALITWMHSIWGLAAACLQATGFE